MPCKPKHAVASTRHYNIHALTLIPYFNSEGRYLHAMLALGNDEAGDKQYYVSITDKEINEIDTSDKNKECSVDCMVNGKENLDTMLEGT